METMIPLHNFKRLWVGLLLVVSAVVAMEDDPYNILHTTSFVCPADINPADFMNWKQQQRFAPENLTESLSLSSFYDESSSEESKEFQCDECEKRFLTKKLLNTHYYINHIKKKEHACQFCGRKFKFLSQVFAHEMRNRNGICTSAIIRTRAKQFECLFGKRNKCGAQFTMRSNCILHLRRYHMPSLTKSAADQFIGELKNNNDE